jgi:S1-C subfamily serine protease
MYSCKLKPRLLGLCLALMGHTTQAKNISEDVFKQAEHYTVKIRTVIEFPFTEDQKGSSSGAGFLIDKNKRWILTNAHVVGRSPSYIKVAFKGEKYVSAQKVYVDPYLDIAIIKIDDPLPNTAQQAKLYCGENLSAGHPVGAFGHPLGLDYTGSRGIISGVIYRNEMEWLQTDASISPGNSGGPLISLETKQVLGINTSRNGDTEGENLNFAISMFYACKIIDLLKQNLNPLPPDVLVSFYENLTEEGQALMIAENYGNKNKLPLLPNDEILQINDFSKKPTNEIHLIHALRGKLKNSRIKVKRNNKEISLVTQWDEHLSPLKMQGLEVSGMIIAEDYFKVFREAKTDNKLMIHSVADDSIARTIGFNPYQGIKSIDGKSFNDIKTLYAYIDKQRRNKKHVFKFITFSLGFSYHYYLYELNAEDIKLTLIGT